MTEDKNNLIYDKCMKMQRIDRTILILAGSLGRFLLFLTEIIRLISHVTNAEQVLRGFNTCQLWGAKQQKHLNVGGRIGILQTDEQLVQSPSASH